MGTFTIRISKPIFDKERELFTAYLEGADTYRWAPDDQRPSQAVHRLAAKMIEKGYAKEFSIYSPPHFVCIDPTFARFIELTSWSQVNPKGRRGVDGSGFDRGQVVRWAGTILGV